MNVEVIITPSVANPNKYFIFRDNGQEIEVTIKDGVFKPSKPLFDFEEDYLNKQFRCTKIITAK